MGLFPERETKTTGYENVEEASPLKIEKKEVVSPIPVNFKAKIFSDKGVQLTNPTQNQNFVIKIPSDSKQTLEDNLKNSDKEESSVWFAGYWIRMIKKALFFGWKVVFGK